MHSLDKDEKQGSKNPPPGAPPHLNGKRAEPDSGLIDLKALADGEISTSMNNIEKQREEQRDAAILASTSSVSLSQIVLPIAGREGKTPIDTVAEAPVAKAALAAGGKAPAQKSRTGLVVALVLGLGAAAGGAFWYIKNSEKKKTSEDNVVAAGGGAQLPTTGQGQVPVEPPGGTMVAAGGPSDPSGGGPVVQPLDTTGGSDVTAPAGSPDDKKAGTGDDKKLAAADDKKAATGDDKKLTPEEKKAAADKKAAAAEDKKAAAEDKKAAADKAAADKVAAADKDKLETGGPTTPKDDSQSEIQKLLAGGGDDKKTDDAPKKTGLDKDEIKAGMNKIKAVVQNCARAEKVVGVIKVRATIAASGSVTSGSVTGEFASNPVAGCVKDAVMAASFPSWTGSPMTVNYSYSVD